jgi:hypothetical protein
MSGIGRAGGDREVPDGARAGEVAAAGGADGADATAPAADEPARPPARSAEVRAASAGFSSALLRERLESAGGAAAAPSHPLPAIFYPHGVRPAPSPAIRPPAALDPAALAAAAAAVAAETRWSDGARDAASGAIAGFGGAPSAAQEIARLRDQALADMGPLEARARSLPAGSEARRGVEARLDARARAFDLSLADAVARGTEEARRRRGPYPDAIRTPPRPGSIGVSSGTPGDVRPPAGDGTVAPEDPDARRNPPPEPPPPPSVDPHTDPGTTGGRTIGVSVTF